MKFLTSAASALFMANAALASPLSRRAASGQGNFRKTGGLAIKNSTIPADSSAAQQSSSKYTELLNIVLLPSRSTHVINLMLCIF